MISKKETTRLVPPEWEDYFKENFVFYWEQGLSAREIAKEMQFKADENGDAPWSPLEVWHVYYFAQKYKLKKRHTQSRSRVI